MKKFLSEIKTAFNRVTLKSEEELAIEIEKIKKRLSKTSLETILPEWFGIVQEVSSRKIGFKHFDSQLKAGFFLHQGKIVEMKTGEGKTLASTLPVSLNALMKKGVHVVTVNDYLAERDQKWMGKIYEGLGLTVGLVKKQVHLIKEKSYFSDITYVTNSELVFDYLRDSSAYKFSKIVQRSFHYCVIDEIDSILIDEARTPLILSSPQDKLILTKLAMAKNIAKSLKREVDFEIDEKRKEIQLTETGYRKTAEKLAQKTLYEEGEPWILDILNALKAEYLFKKNKNYIVLNNQVQIIDEFTGRIMSDRRWSMGIHEAIESKEKVEIGGRSKTRSSITYQNFFPLYPKLAGMTGTGKTAEREFQEIYNLDVVVIETSKPMIRKDLPDLVYQSELAKWKAVLKKTEDCFQKGQPVLIGTSSVEKSEFLSDLFTISKIPHQVLNAKPENVQRESEIIAQAGKPSGVTIATNMAGRGTDIILGGNPLFEVKQKMYETLLENKESTSLKEMILTEYKKLEKLDQLEEDIRNLPYSLDVCSPSFQSCYQELYQEILTQWKKDNSIVKSLGGLFVIGTERQENRRIDNQLRGRSGRQGDPGFSQFFISLEDDLVKVFGGESLQKWVNYLVQDKDVPLESTFLTKNLENAQEKVESYNYDLRKNIFQYDEILNLQRKQLFKVRKDLLSQKLNEDFFLRYLESFFDEEMQPYWKRKTTQDSYELEKWFPNYSDLNNHQKPQTQNSEIWIWYDLRLAETDCYQFGFLKHNKLIQLLTIMDCSWTDHIERMNSIRDTISWRAYGQQNPLTEYNRDSFKSFKLMFDEIRLCMIYFLFNNPIN
uniref:Protein translocase subunit SecA n=1 Tax=Synura sphagnicola TaxID=52556 RepID=A0A3G2QYZ4_9STRA|nr:preprotein translocase subunit SecA [Synura sphagnicola]AYO28314.1 preprotein translocase subunit SecA [Synura sphagnicola]